MGAERKFLLFDGPGGAMGIGLFLRRDLFFARKREKKILFFLFSFLVVFLRFLVVISRFGGVFALREFFFGFFFSAGP